MAAWIYCAPCVIMNRKCFTICICYLQKCNRLSHLRCTELHSWVVENGENTGDACYKSHKKKEKISAQGNTLKLAQTNVWDDLALEEATASLLK